MTTNDESKDESMIWETDKHVMMPVAVILERHIDPSKKWGYPEWKVHAVVTGEHIQQQDQQITLDDDGRTARFFYGGLRLALYKDGSEGYWYNLLSEDPYLFVVCDGSLSDKQIEPQFVTVNQDDAMAHLETDDPVLSIPMPIAIRDKLEQYVLTHFHPEQKKKRKRKNWAEESGYANPNRESSNRETPVVKEDQSNGK